MSKGTLPGLARKRRDIRAEAAIPCAIGTPTTSAVATHLTGDRDREPSFEDLLAGNDREPSHDDLTADVDEPAEQPRPKLYPGVSKDALAWLRAQDTIEQLPTMPAPERDEHAFDADRLVPAKLRVKVPLPATTDVTQGGVPGVPVADGRRLFDALDALDQLPSLYVVDAKAFEIAANLAAIQTYVAIRPELLAPTGLGADLLALELHDLAALLESEV